MTIKFEQKSFSHLLGVSDHFRENFDRIFTRTGDSTPEQPPRVPDTGDLRERTFATYECQQYMKHTRCGGIVHTPEGDRVCSCTCHREDL